MTTSSQNYKEVLSRLKSQLASSRFLRWWLGELSSLVPAWMRPSKLDADQFMAIPLEQVNAQWSRPEGGERRDLVLTLPRSHVLSKTVTLPLATEENLRQVLEFQIEQHTPFAPNQVYFGYMVSGRDFDKGQLAVELEVAPRNAVDAAIKTLGVQGAEVRAVFSQEMWVKGNFVNLLPEGLGSVPSPLMLGANPWLVALVILLALSATTMPLIIKREAVIQMLPWVEKGKTAAESVDAVRRGLDARVDQHNYLLEKRQLMPAIIQILEELTRILPDDTWVQTLDIKGRELQIQGETASSVRLIGLFEQSSIFKDASFRSPLTKGLVSGSEHFQLAIQVRSAASPISVASATSSPVSSAALASASSAPAQNASEPATAAFTGVKRP